MKTLLHEKCPLYIQYPGNNSTLHTHTHVSTNIRGLPQLTQLRSVSCTGCCPVAPGIPSHSWGRARWPPGACYNRHTKAQFKHRQATRVCIGLTNLALHV